MFIDFLWFLFNFFYIIKFKFILKKFKMGDYNVKFVIDGYRNTYPSCIGTL